MYISIPRPPSNNVFGKFFFIGEDWGPAEGPSWDLGTLVSPALSSPENNPPIYPTPLATAGAHQPCSVPVPSSCPAGEREQLFSWLLASQVPAWSGSPTPCLWLQGLPLVLLLCWGLPLDSPPCRGSHPTPQGPSAPAKLLDPMWSNPRCTERGSEAEGQGLIPCGRLAGSLRTQKTPDR